MDDGDIKDGAGVEETPATEAPVEAPAEPAEEVKAE